MAAIDNFSRIEQLIIKVYVTLPLVSDSQNNEIPDYGLSFPACSCAQDQITWLLIERRCAQSPWTPQYILCACSLTHCYAVFQRSCVTLPKPLLQIVYIVNDHCFLCLSSVKLLYMQSASSSVPYSILQKWRKCMWNSPTNSYKCYTAVTLAATVIN